MNKITMNIKYDFLKSVNDENMKGRGNLLLFYSSFNNSKYSFHNALNMNKLTIIVNNQENKGRWH